MKAISHIPVPFQHSENTRTAQSADTGLGQQFSGFKPVRHGGKQIAQGCGHLKMNLGIAMFHRGTHQERMAQTDGSDMERYFEIIVGNAPVTFVDTRLPFAQGRQHHRDTEDYQAVAQDYRSDIFVPEYAYIIIFTFEVTVEPFRWQSVKLTNVGDFSRNSAISNILTPRSSK